MSRLGEYLAQAGALTNAQFEEAYRSQRVHGGRLGTNLVEQGFLVLDELAEHLSAFHETPLPPPEWLEAPDPKALQLVPMALIRRFNLLPLKLERDCVHVAMVDPTDAQQLDFLRQATSRDVRAYVLPEVRILYWLETHCGIDRHPRYVNLAARVRQTGLGPAAGRSIAEEDFEVEQPNRGPLPAPKPLNLDEFAFALDDVDDAADGGAELLLEEIVSVEAEPAQRESAPVPLIVPSDPGEIAALEAELQGARERDAVIELGLRIASGFARSAALFVVRADTVTGHRCVSDGAIGKLDAVLLPLDAASIFTQPAVSGAPFRGLPPHDGMDGRILSAIGRPDAHEVFIQPISIRGRVVNLLYVDNGGDALADTSVAALTALAKTMARAYERLILDAKRAAPGAAGG